MRREMLQNSSKYSKQSKYYGNLKHVFIVVALPLKKMRTVSTRSSTIENANANEKISKANKAGDGHNKSRNPFSDISNQVMERFSSRPIAIKSTKQQSHPLANALNSNHIEQQPSKDLMVLMENSRPLEQQIEEIDIDGDERKIKRR